MRANVNECNRDDAAATASISDSVESHLGTPCVLLENNTQSRSHCSDYDLMFQNNIADVLSDYEFSQQSSILFRHAYNTFSFLSFLFDYFKL